LQQARGDQLGGSSIPLRAIRRAASSWRATGTFCQVVVVTFLTVPPGQASQASRQSGEVDDLLSAVADFFTAGAVRSAMAAGVRAAIEGGGSGGLADLLSDSTVRVAAALGSATAVRLDAQIDSMSLTRHGAALVGSLSAGPAPAVQAGVGLAELPGKWRLLTAFDSWAPGDAIASVTYGFGDGETTTRSGADIALAVPHLYRSGQWGATVTVRDTAGRQRVASSLIVDVV
jgi:hypothetical protein